MVRKFKYFISNFLIIIFNSFKHTQMLHGSIAIELSRSSGCGEIFRVRSNESAASCKRVAINLNQKPSGHARDVGRRRIH